MSRFLIFCLIVLCLTFQQTYSSLSVPSYVGQGKKRTLDHGPFHKHVPGYEETTRRRNYISGYRNQQREPNDKSGRDGISYQGRFPEQGPTFVEQ
ncbi:hypothetical protein ABFA07_011135 [Porites harrisoni]